VKKESPILAIWGIAEDDKSGAILTKAITLTKIMRYI